MLYRFHFLIAIVSWTSLSSALAAEKVTYEDDIRPILREHCFACHNQDEATAGLVLDSFEGLTTGGASGEVVAAGDLEGSRLWKLVSHQEEPTMPPDNKLPEKQLQVLRVWIEGGLLKDAGSKPIKRKKTAIAKIDVSKLGKPIGEPAMPEQLFHEPVLWTSRTGPVNVLATSPWAPLAAVAWQRQVSFYDTNTHLLLGVLPYVDGVPQVVRFSRDGSLVLVAGGRHAAAGSATLFEVKTGARLVTLGDELDIVLAADISSDLSLVAIGGPKKKVRVYHVADGTLAYQINKHTDWITALGFSPDGRLLATADRNGGALLWQAAAGHERGDLRGHKASITSLDWRADSAMLATASEDGTVRLWNPAGKQIKSIAAHRGGVLSVRFSKAGDWVSAGRDQKVKTWKSSGGAIADLGKMPGIALAAAFTHDGAKVIASDYTGEIRVFDIASKKKVATLQANPLPLAQRLANTEKRLQQTQQKLQGKKAHSATLLAALDLGKAAHIAHENKLAKTQAALATARKKYEALTEEKPEEEILIAEKGVQAAEATLAQVSNETGGLPDLEKLGEQYDLAEAEVATAQQQFNKAQQTKAVVVAQQKRYAEALALFAKEAQRQQAKRKELRSAKIKLQKQEHQLALELAEIKKALGESQQQAERIEAGKNDFDAAEAERKAYTGAAE